MKAVLIYFGKMFVVFIVYAFVLALQSSDAYVLVQVRKQDNNHSNIDALIHKVVPNDKVDELAKNIVHSQPEALALKDNSAKSKDDIMRRNKMHKGDTTWVEVLDYALKKIVDNGRKSFNVKRANDFKAANFRSDSSFTYELKPDGIIDTVNEILSSNVLKAFVDKLSRRAAIAVSTMNNKETQQ